MFSTCYAPHNALLVLGLTSYRLCETREEGNWGASGNLLSQKLPTMIALENCLLSNLKDNVKDKEKDKLSTVMAVENP